MQKSYYWYCGKLIASSKLELEINDPGLLYGATVFTTLRVYDHSLDSSLTNWKPHCDRLQYSIQTFNWQEPNWNLIRQGAELLSVDFPVLRITLFPDGREWIIGKSLPEDLTEKQKNAIICALANPELNRSLPSHKTGNYLNSWLAKTASSKAQEAILVDKLGNWLETSTGNLWGWFNGCWWTPPLEAGILPGIARQHLINQLKSSEITVKQEPWTTDIFEKLEAIAYTNSVVEIIPIHTVQQTTGSLQYNPYHPSLSQLRRFFLP